MAAAVGFFDRMYHVFLPALTLAMVKSAFLGRLTRTSLLETLGKDYVRTARAKGARENRASSTATACATRCCRSRPASA